MEVFAAAVGQLRRRCCSGCAGVLLKRLCGMVYERLSVQLVVWRRGVGGCAAEAVYVTLKSRNEIRFGSFGLDEEALDGWTGPLTSRP